MFGFALGHPAEASAVVAFQPQPPQARPLDWAMLGSKRMNDMQLSDII